MNTYKLNKNTRLQSCIDGITTIGPEKVHIDLINSCQLNCVTCWHWGEYSQLKKNNERKSQQINFDKLNNIILELKEINVERIILSGGGEIFLYPNIMQIIKKIKSTGIKLTLISNILLLNEKKANELVEIGVDTILANISAGCKETYIQYHPNQTDESYNKLINNLFILSKIRDLKLVQVINNINYKDIADMIKLSQQLNAGIQLKLASIPTGAEKFALSGDQINEIYNNLDYYKKLINDKPIINNLDAFEAQLKNNTHKFPIQDIGCYAGYLYSRITVDGNVTFCCKDFKIGNIYKNTFKEIRFESELIKKYRETLRNKQYFSSCYECGNRSLNFKAKNEIENFINNSK